MTGLTINLLTWDQVTLTTAAWLVNLPGVGLGGGGSQIGKRAETTLQRGFEGREERNKIAFKEGERLRGVFKM